MWKCLFFLSVSAFVQFERIISFIRIGMKKNRLIILLILLVLMGVSLYGINKDLFHYEYTFPFSRVFSPETNSKGGYLVTDPIPLKIGHYDLSLTGFSEGIGSGCYVLDAGDEIIFSEDIPSGTITVPFALNIRKNTSVRVGFNYDPTCGILEIGQIRILGDHVLYKESVLRHAFFSLLAIAVFFYIGLRVLNPGFREEFLKRTGIDLKQCERIFTFLTVLTVLASLPLLDLTRFTEGDDFYFHASRINGIALSLKAGHFPPRILLGWLQNYGIGSGFYYPDMLLWIPAGLCILGVSAVNALRVFMILCTFFSLLTIYLAAKNLMPGEGDGTVSGIAAAVLYAFAAYRLICIFYRCAVGEVQAFIFYPLVLWGFIEILRGNTEKWKLFAFGFFGLLMSHMISLAISGVLCALCLLFFIPRLLKNSKIPEAFFKAALVTIMLGAFFLLPMAEQALNNDLVINSFTQELTEVRIFNLSKFRNTFLPFDSWMFDGDTKAHPYPGYALLLVPFMRLYLLLRKKRDPRMALADRFLIIGLLLLIVSTDLFPWKWFVWFIIRIQFSWRFLGPASLLLCMAGASYFDMILAETKHKKAGLCVLLTISLLSGLPLLVYTCKEKLYSLDRLVLSNKNVTGAEYLPTGFDPLFIEINKNQVLYDHAGTRVETSRRQGVGYVFSFENQSEGTPQDYSVPLIYYYGYEASLTDAGDVTRKIPVTKDENGLVSVNDQGLASGTIRVSYGKTTGQKLGEGISLVTLAVIIFAAFYRGMKKKRNRSAAEAV